MNESDSRYTDEVLFKDIDVNKITTKDLVREIEILRLEIGNLHKELHSLGSKLLYEKCI